MRPAFSVGEAAAMPPYPSVADAILAGVRQFPDGRFVYFRRDGERRQRSYEETLERAHGLLAGLRGSGMRKGDALVVALADAGDAVAALWAAALGGFVAVPLVRSADPAASSALDTESLAFLKETFGAIRVLAHSDADLAHDPAVLDIEALSRVPVPAGVETIAGSPEELRFAIATSGTTARPRLVGLSDAAALARWWPHLPDAAHATGFLSWSSFDHVMGLGLAMPNLPLKVHLDAVRFVATPLSWLDALEATGATHTTMTNFGMSLVVRAVAENPDRRWRLDHVRKVGIGAEAISRSLCDRFLKCLAAFGLREDALILGYGLSECGPVVGGSISFSGGGAGGVDAPPELDRPTRGHAVRIVGDDGYLMREGEVGSIEVRGPTMTSGYLGDEAATAALLTPDHWLRTGDLGLLRDGKLTVVGRKKELVIVNARKYTCQEIEAAVKSGTDFAEVYATPFGDADETGAGAPCAVFVVAGRPGELASESVAEGVRTATAKAFRFAPRVVALLSPDDVPRTSLGKVRRLALPDLLTDSRITGQVSRLSGGSPSAALDSEHMSVEARIARIWRELLGSEGEIDRNADFFALGGDSLLALRMAFLMEDEFGVPVRIEQFATGLTIAELALFLSGAPTRPRAKAGSPPPPGLPDWLVERLHGFLETWPGTPAVPGGFVRRIGSAAQGIPVFWCMQHAEEAVCFEKALGGRFPAYAMRSGMLLLDYDTPLAAALTDRYVEEIRQICPEGPLVIAGTCQGFNIALAATRRLVAEGRDVRLLIAADCRFADLCGTTPVPVPVALFSATGSKFNPYRFFRHPEVGLRKLAPHGLHLEMIDTAYAKIMLGTAMEHLIRGAEAAIARAGSRDPAAAAPAPSPIAFYQRHVSSPTKKLELRTGERLGLAVRLKNTSPVAWDAFERSGLAVGNHWLSENGAMLAWADGRTLLDQGLQPGERAYLTLDIVAPATPGRYLLEVDLIEEGICWFADFALAPLHIPVDVASSRTAQGSRPRRWWHSFLLPAVFALANRIPLLKRASRRNR